MRAWDVTLEVAVGDGSPTPLEDLADDLVERLSDADGVVSIVNGRVIIDVTVRGRGYTGALKEASSHVRRALGACGVTMHAGLIGRAEVCAANLANERLSQPTYPPMLGVAEVAEKLGVSKQRVFELREAARLPEPITELRAGPVWPEPAIDRWLDTWERKPGRPKKAASSG